MERPTTLQIPTAHRLATRHATGLTPPTVRTHPENQVLAAPANSKVQDCNQLKQLMITHENRGLISKVYHNEPEYKNLLAKMSSFVSICDYYQRKTLP